MNQEQTMVQALRERSTTEPFVGQTWVNPVSGLEYRWTGKTWKSTGRHPFGTNPMGF